LARPHKSRQRSRHHHGGGVLELNAGAGRHVDAELREHVVEALDRERGLRGLVTTAIQADDEAVADQRVLAHAGNAGQIFDAVSVCRSGHEPGNCAQCHQGRAKGAT